MLSMKTLRVAIVTMGSALLLGPGFAAATIQILDGTGDDAPSAIKYASQTVPIAATDADRVATGAITPPGATRPSHYQVISPDTDPDGTGTHANHKLTVSLSRRVESTDSVYIRLDLGGGMLFAPAADSELRFDAPNDAQTPASAMEVGTELSNYADRTSGGAGHSFIIYNATPADAIPVGSVIWVDVVDDLAVPPSPGSHTARIRSYGNADDAIDGPGATSAASGSATIVTVESGIHAEVKSETAIADVATIPEPFLWFKTTTGNSSMAVLGSATAVARAAVGVFNADTGDLVENEQLLPATSLTVGIEGDFSIGAFSLGEPAANVDNPDTNDVDESMTRMDASTICLDQGTAGDDEPEMGNVNEAASEDNPTMSGIGMLSAGTQYLCVQVDRMGAGSNRSPIPPTTYTGTITMGSGESAMTLAEGPIGEIKRNGTTVQVAYLTDSAKYNQRLIIVNRGPVAARFDISSFTEEVGSDTTVELSAEAQAAKAAGLNVIPAGGQVVLRVADILTFTGERKRRVGATISINADVDDIQVATTQVNLADSSTDTVIYASEDGARIQ